MKKEKVIRASWIPAAAAIAVVLSAADARASLVLTEDFESPDVTDAQSDGFTSGAIPSGWVGATQGFGASRRGVVDESHGDFTDPVGEQAFAFRYTNSGLTTAEGVIGLLTSGSTYSVSFDVVLDGHNSSTPYSAYLAAFDDGATSRNDIRSNTNQRTVLASTGGNATGDGLYTTINFLYTSDGTEGALLGRDVGLVFVGATSSAIIDNVMVDVEAGAAIPEASEALVALLGMTGLVAARRRRASSVA